ncbi:MAG TPA: ATP-binding protein [Ramlibacter sp.]|uniref:ATP-binding protein n=1 Tax=Ramlibacter sp. TaxID=1917967 RepID=UPI002ED4DDF5
MAAFQSHHDDEQQRQAHCEKHGAYTSHRIDYMRDRWTGCTKCVEEEHVAQKAKQLAAEKEDLRRRRMTFSGLQGRFAEATFDNFKATTAEQRAVLNACRDFARTVTWNSGSGLWLIGPPGTGKTHLASAVVRHVIEERDATAEIYTSREIIRKLRAMWGNRGGREDRDWLDRPQTEEAMIDDLGRTPLLVIDEAGVGFGTEAEMVQLYDVVDLRYKLRRPTVLVSNLAAEDLKTALGDRAYDRLREGAKMLTCKWKSHRGAPPSPHGLEAVK